MNKFQILGIIAACLALSSVGTFYAYKPIGESMTKSSSISQVLLALAVGATAIALIISQSNGSSGASGLGNSDAFVPHVMHQQHQPHRQQYQQPNNFIMKEGLEKQKSLGRRLKDAGWVVVLADWCGFCVKQKALFDELADDELDLIVVKEDAQTPAQKLLNDGFPAFMCISKNLKSPGFLDSREKLEALLDMK